MISCMSQCLTPWFTPLLSPSISLPLVPPCLLQPPVPLSLPVHMSVNPASWQFLPLSQAELSPLFSNSSPFSFSQSLFMLPPPGTGSRPSLRASFGPYSVTQVKKKRTGETRGGSPSGDLCYNANHGHVSVCPQHLSEPVVPLTPPLSASLLSEHVEREWDEGGQTRFRVRVLFHQRGDTSTQGTYITLHAFKETEEHKASCTTQVRSRFSLILIPCTLSLSFFLSVRLSVSCPSLL